MDTPPGTKVTINSRFHQVSQELRTPYIEYLFQIGREQDNLRWWTTTIAWRNAYTSPSFQQICYLKTALDLAQDWDGPEDLLLICQGPLHRALAENFEIQGFSYKHISGSKAWTEFTWLSDKLKLTAHRAFFIARETYRIVQSRRSLPCPKPDPGPTVLLMSWVTAANWRQGSSFHSSFFGELAALMDQRGLNVATVPMILKDVPYGEALAELANSLAPVLAPHSTLGIFDPLRAAAGSVAGPGSDFPPLEGMAVKAILNEELRRDRITNNSAHAMLLAIMVRRWSQSAWSFQRIIYIYENQPWEKAVCSEVRRAMPDTTLVGYQPTPVPQLLLNFYLADEESSIAPLPHRVVTVGRLSAEALLAGGYAPGSVAVGGALQLQDLLVQDLFAPVGAKEEATDGHSPQQRIPTVLVASSAGLEETLELVLLAAELFDVTDGVHVVVKCHPIMPFDRVSQYLDGPLPNHVTVSEEPIHRLISSSSLMVYSGSTVCIQALALGVPVVHVRPQMDFDLDPLEGVPELRPEATNIDELRHQVRWLLDHLQEYIEQKRGAWARFVSETYSPVTEESINSFVE